MNMHSPEGIRFTRTPFMRRAIEDQIEKLIAILDAFDGDPDMEPDHEDYDACDPGEPDCTHPEHPVYGIDQSKGPTNAASVFGEFARSVEL